MEKNQDNQKSKEVEVDLKYLLIKKGRTISQDTC